MKKFLFWLFMACVVLLGVYALWTITHHASTPRVTASVAESLPAHKAGPDSYYPNPEQTPGDVVTTDEKVVCEPGYAGSVRHVTRSEKVMVYGWYGLSFPQAKGAYEFDHFISLELGGSNDPKNLWPEPAEPTPGFHEKDVVENYLHHEVCVTHSITLLEAQREIRTDWYAVYLRIQNQ